MEFQMDSNDEHKSGNRDLTPSERRFALAILAWLGACIWIGVFEPKLGIGLFIAGIVITFIVAAAMFSH